MNETWVEISTIPGFEIYTNYYVSDLGTVKSTKRKEKLLTLVPRLSKSGKSYLRAQLWANSGKKYFSVNRLILLAFKYNPNHKNLEGNHIDEDTLNNKLSNLQWLTPLENVLKSSSKRRKFSEQTNKEIIAKYTSGAIYKDLAEEYKCTIETVFRIVNEFFGENGRKRTKFTEVQKLDVINDKVSITLKEISVKYNCSVGYIRNILKRAEN